MAIVTERRESENSITNSLIVFSEKLALWSGIVIILSIVLVVMLLSKNSVNLSIQLWYLPLSFYLYISWLFLGLSVALGIFARRQHAIYALKKSKKYSRDFPEIINFLPVLFCSGILLLFIFVIGAINPIMKNGAVYNFYQRPFFDMMNMRQHSKWMAMQNCNHHPHNEGQAVAPQYDAPLK